MKLLLIIFTTLIVLPLSAQINPDSTKVRGKKLVFSDGSSFETPLSHLKILGYLPNNGKTPFYILEGRDCSVCDAPDEIFIHNPEDGELHLEIVSNRFPFPGIEYSRRDSNMVIYEGRAFLGMVLLNKTNAMIWYQKVKMPDGKMYDNILIAEIINGKLRSTIQSPETAKISETLKLLDLGKCREIEGKPYLTER